MKFNGKRVSNAAYQELSGLRLFNRVTLFMFCNYSSYNVLQWPATDPLQDKVFILQQEMEVIVLTTIFPDMETNMAKGK